MRTGFAVTAQSALVAEVQTLRRQLAEALSANRAKAGKEGRSAAESKPLPLDAALDDAEEELGWRGQVFKAIFDGVSEGILLVDSTGMFLNANPAACAFLGAPKSELLGQRSEDFAAPGYDASSERQRLRASGGGHGLFPVRRADGTLREFEYDATRDILPGLHLSVLRDVTEQKRIQKALEASEKKYRQIVDTAREGIWLVDAQARTTFVNRALEGMLGQAPGEMLGKSVFDFMDDEGRALAEESLERRRLGATERKDQKYLHKDGTPVWVQMEANPLVDDQGNYEGALAMVSVVTDRRKAEEALRASEERYRLLFESSPLAIWLTDLETQRFLAANSATLELFGYQRAEFLRLSVADVLSSDELTKIREIQEKGSDGRINYGIRHPTRKDGTVLNVEVTSQACMLDGRRVGLIIAQDMTERHKLEARLAQSRKMEAIAILAGGVAHDFNNLLSIIVTYAAFALEALEPLDPIRADLEQVASAGERAVSLTRQLLAFSRRQLLEPQVMDLNHALSATAPALRRLLGASIELCFLLEPALANIHADPDQIEQVILNLAMNAREAMPDGGKLTIATTNLSVDSTLPGADPALGSGVYVKLTISDTGFGMSTATREHVFEPFFTTKEVGKGSGLGLPTVLGIIQQSGGHLDLQSQLGTGTRVEIYLPTVNGNVAVRTIVPPDAPLGGTETLLVVEDNEQVRKLTGSILRRCGYHVLLAEGSEQALLMAAGHPRPVHLLLTDLLMPHMTGRELAERLRASRPDMKVLFMTGYTDDAIVRRGLIDGAIDLLKKPVTPQVLARRVRAVLDAGSRGSDDHSRAIQS